MDRFGRYELLFEIGSGGMARVYLARQLGDSGFERLVAVKRVHAHLVGDPDIYSMVSDEARIAALLRHPNVVSVVDVVDRAGELLLVLDYVEGFALSKLSKRWKKPLPPALASRVVVDGLAGLHAAHEARDLMGERLDVIHRDVSPQNLLVGVDGVTRVIDFGIARARGNATLTQTGVVKGKVAYMAPERLDEKAVDRRADLFAMGAVLNELLLGETAKAESDEARDIARAMLSTFDPSRVEAVAPKLAPVIERALARKPSDRFANGEEMARAIAAAEPPASPLEIAAWVASVEETAIAERRAKICEAVEAALVADDPTPEPRPPKSQPLTVVPARESAVAAREPAPPIEAPRPRGRAGLWVGLGLAGLAAANVATWFALRPKDAVSANEPPRSAAVTSADARVSPVDPVAPASSSRAALEPPATSTSPATSSFSTGAPSTPIVLGIPPRASTTTSAPAPSTSSGLQANPYGSH